MLETNAVRLKEATMNLLFKLMFVLVLICFRWEQTRKNKKITSNLAADSFAIQHSRSSVT